VATREIGKTTEALRPVAGSTLGENEIGKVEGSLLVVPKGPGFIREFVQGFVMPQRWDVAQLVLANLLRDPKHREEVLDEVGRKRLAELAFAMADEFVLTMRPSLYAGLDRYYEQYMTRDDGLDAAMRGLVEESKDYSL